MATILDETHDLKYYGIDIQPLGPEDQASLDTYIAWRAPRKDAIKLRLLKVGKSVDDAYWEADWATAATTVPEPEIMVPKRLKVCNRDHLADYIANGPYVSQRFKDIIEEIEPGVHQFVPVAIYHGDGETQFVGPMYRFGVATVLDAIDGSTGGVKTVAGEVDGYQAWQIKDREKLAVKRDLVAGRAAWIDVRYQRGTFISDEVIRALEEHKLTGWRAKNYWAGKLYRLRVQPRNDTEIS